MGAKEVGDLSWRYFFFFFLKKMFQQVPTTTVDIVSLNGFPNPKNNEAWMILCRDPQWNYQNTKDDNDNGKMRTFFWQQCGTAAAAIAVTTK